MGLLLASYGALQGQVPSNDLPCGATQIAPGGCFDGNTIGANDDTNGQGVGADCQSHGNNIDVWFSFVATNSGFNFQVFHDTLIGGTFYNASSIDLILYRMSSFTTCDPAMPCGNPNECVYNDLVGIACWEDDGSRALNGTTAGLIPGERYYFLISSATVGGENPGTFRVCFDNLPFQPSPAPNCSDAETLCDNSSFHNSDLGFVPSENISTNSCFAVSKNQVKWYQVTFGTSGQFGFNIVPDNPADDYDWLAWNSSLNPCDITMPLPEGCNWSGCSGPTGMDNLTNDCNGNPAINYDAFGDAGASPVPIGPGLFDVIAGETWTILIDNWSSGSGYTFNFSSDMTAMIGPQSNLLIEDISCNGLDMRVEARAEVVTPGFYYSWNMGDGTFYDGVSSVAHTYSGTQDFVVQLSVIDTNSNNTCISVSEQRLDCPLPMVFAGFDIQANEKGIKLNWYTPMNLPTDRFEIMRSVDQINWLKIGTVRAGRSCNQTMCYSILDETLLTNTAHYRVKHFDPGGTQTGSEILSIRPEDKVIRKLMRVVDLMGRTVTRAEESKVYFYWYDDGSIEKKMVMN